MTDSGSSVETRRIMAVALLLFTVVLVLITPVLRDEDDEPGGRLTLVGSAFHDWFTWNNDDDTKWTGFAAQLVFGLAVLLVVASCLMIVLRRPLTVIAGLLSAAYFLWLAVMAGTSWKDTDYSEAIWQPGMAVLILPPIVAILVGRLVRQPPAAGVTTSR